MGDAPPKLACMHLSCILCSTKIFDRLSHFFTLALPNPATSHQLFVVFVVMSNPKKRAAAEERLPEKKAKKKKGNTQDDDNLDIELGLNTLFSRMDNQLLADHMLQKTTRFGSDLSSVELSDISLSGKDASMGVLPLPTLPRVMTDR
jgi:hypothetical protein